MSSDSINDLIKMRLDLRLSRLRSSDLMTNDGMNDDQIEKFKLAGMSMNGFDIMEAYDILKKEEHPTSHESSVIYLYPLLNELNSEKLFPNDVDIIFNSQIIIEKSINKSSFNGSVGVNLMILQLMRLMVKIVDHEKHDSDMDSSPNNQSLSIYCFPDQRVLSDRVSHQYQMLVTSLLRILKTKKMLIEKDIL
jgi:hypothetical protein